MHIKVTVDTRQVKRALADLKGNAPKAIMRALNKTVATAKTLAKRQIAADLHLKQAAVQRGLRIDRATPARLTATLTATGYRIPLREFAARQTRPGVTYNLGRGRKLLPHAFLARMRSGHVGVFTRAGRRRLPIAEKRGPSIPHVLGSKRIMAAVLATSREALAKNLKHETEYLVSRQAARRG